MKEIHIRDLKEDNGRDSIISMICGFESEVAAVVNGKKLNAKSIMNTLVIDHARNIDFTITGVDEEWAEAAIKKLYNLD